MVSLAAKIEYVSINSNCTQEIMTGRKKKLKYSEKLHDFLNITLARPESAIVTKRHLVDNKMQINIKWPLLHPTRARKS